MQFIAVGQSTPDRTLLYPEPGLCGVWIVQLVPSRASARAWSGGGLPPTGVAYAPAAVQDVAAVQDTAARPLLAAPPGFRLCGAGVQLAPFHCSPRATCGPEAVVELPTAVQAVAVVQDTPERLLVAGPGRFGVGWIVQFVPFQFSASVAPLPCPTALQALAAVQETLWKLPPAAGVGVVWTVQLLPLDCSASVTLPGLLPTAVQAVAVQDTSRRPLDTPSRSVDWTDQAPPFHCSTKVPALIVQPGVRKQLQVGCPLLQWDP